MKISIKQQNTKWGSFNYLRLTNWLCIFDDNNHCIDVFTGGDIDSIMNYLTDTSSEFDFFEYFFDTFVYNNTYIGALDCFIDTIPQPSESKLKTIKCDMKKLNGIDFCEKYNIYKIANKYFIGDVL